jgi:hypothetical protein
MIKVLQATKSLVTKHSPLFILLSIVLLGAFLRLQNLGCKNMWYDEIHCVEITRESIPDQIRYAL